ncbi:phosphodiesterase [Dechloromonas denitrificans]|uniref:Phosphodiesterase n=1 Tax=Dechloromonas denitrificans TaxID=281362 RepID=A0A133XG73_9RHOO|nr:HD-GYP domain-containing protein [Dechloromonas denitrificans]KXB29950.1 phosphodiesterase [Dechloromonas denitrificans]
MIKQIRAEQLKPGMYIHDLNCGWLDHPFISNAFHVRDTATVDKIVKLGIRELYIDTLKGADVWEGRTQQEVNADLERRLQEIAQKQPEKPISTELKEETARARRLHGEANKIIRHMMDDIRLGQQIQVERVEPLVEGMVDSIFRNQDALLPLARLKRHDDYTFAHSVSVCALLVAFGRGMKLERAVIKDLAMGGLLHDVGKARIPDQILNKPAKLSDEEFTRMQSHVAQGVVLLKDSPGVSKIALQVVGEHHERFDGTGYPRHLADEKISLYGQMAAIVDVYDAISSERVYHKGMPPTQALKKLLEWSSHHFDQQLVQSFIRAIGIYPTGTLVQLESKRLGVVTEQNEGNLLEPVVRIFYHAGQQHYIPPEIVDLSKVQDRIGSFESYEKWKIDPYQWLPA